MLICMLTTIAGEIITRLIDGHAVAPETTLLGCDMTLPLSDTEAYSCS